MNQTLNLYLSKDRFPNTLAYIISGLISPEMVTAIIPEIIIATYAHNPVQFWELTLIWVLFILTIPGSFVWRKISQGEISNIHINIRVQRLRPFIILVLGIANTLLFFIFLRAPGEIIEMAYVFLLNSIVLLLITIFWKISLHTAAIAGTTFIASELISPYFLWMLLLIPPVIWARVYRHRHTIWQGVLGVFIVILTSYVAIKWLNLFLTHPNKHLF